MKKSIFLIACLGLLLFFASSNATSHRGGEIGDIASDFRVENADTAVSLQQLRGKYVLVSFWSSRDARSRIANIECNALSKKFDNQLVYISVNYDHNEALFEELVQSDKLQPDAQFFDRDGSSSSIFEDYSLGRGYKTCLINPAGEIVAENPGAFELTKILGQ